MNINFCRLPVGFAALFAACSLFVFSTTSCGRRPSAQIEQGVQLVLNTEQLQPTSTFEIRFDEPVVPRSHIGLTAPVSPVRISPALPGKFTWLSTRSGVFTPSAPTLLGTAYTVSLASDFQPQPVPATPLRLSREFTTPEFGVIATSPGESASANLTSQPQIQVLFNENISFPEAKKRVYFRDKKGNKVGALVEPATAENYFYAGNIPGGSANPWSERFSEPKENPPIRNRIIVRPENPLPIGEGWKLVVRHGVPSLDSSISTKEAFELSLGDVTPFSVTSTSAHNGVSDGRSLEVRFSKQISPDVKAGQAASWITIKPEPPRLTPVMNGSSIIFQGDFRLDQQYEVTVREGLPAAEAFKLEAPFKTAFTFTPLPPRIYLPGFSARQLAFGTRHFDVLALNVPEVNVRAWRVSADDLIPTLEAYNAYMNPPQGRDRGLEPYYKVDETLIRGEPFFSRVFPNDKPVDVSSLIPLQWDTILGAEKPGIVFLTVERPGSEKLLGTQALVQVTDLGLIWKRDREQFFVCAFSCRTGQPLAGVDIRALTNKNTPVGSATTDASGIARIPAPTTAAWLRLQKGGDLHAVSVSDSGSLPVYQFNISVNWYSEVSDDRKVLLFSERPVYRPGEMFYIKGIVRDWTGTALSIPAKVAGEIRIYDSRDRIVAKKSVRLSTAGSFDAALQLPVGTLGSYRADFYQGENIASTSHYFQVQEYSPNAFEIKMDVASAIPAADPVRVPLSAAYYMGKSLSKARLRWSIEASDAGFQPAGFDKFQFCTTAEYSEELQRQSSSLALQGDQPLSEEGKVLLTPEIPINPKAPQPRNVNVLAEITDLNQQTVSERATFTRQSSDFYLGLEKSDAVWREGDDVPIVVAAVDPEGEPLASPVKSNVTISRVEWRTVRVQGAGGSITYRTEPDLQPAGELSATTVSLIEEGEQWIPAKTANAPQWKAGKPGLYLVEVKAKDQGGRPVITTATFNVAGRDETTWDYRNPAQVDLVPERSSYAPGESATILIKTPLSGKALVTIEREKVLRSFVTELIGNAPTIKIPLQETDAPNVFVSVTLLRGSDASPKKIKEPEYRYGYCQLKVQKPTTHLGVSVTPLAPDYRPGDKVTLDVAVTDYRNKPQTGAEVTLFAVDEGILSLMGYTAPDPLAWFHTERPLVVRTGLSLTSMQAEDPAKVGFANKGYLIGDGGDEGGGLRKNFLACAFWNATLQTGGDGHVRATFTAPDSLTRYRIIAVASSGAERFGTAESAFAINKPLMLIPALPRFANVGDTIKARAVVHNQSAQGGLVEVTLQLDDLASLAEKTTAVQTIELAAGKSGAIEFPLEFRETGSARWTWKARFAGDKPASSFTDAIQTTLNVSYPISPRREVHVSRVTDAEANLFKPVDPQLLEGTGNADVTISNTRLVEIAGAVNKLLKYPYGCVEQTTSSMLPWIVLRDMAATIPAVNRPSAQIDAAVNRGINRLLGMQTSSGGLSYWPGGAQPQLWGSAYGGYALVRAKAQGYDVPESSLDQLAGYLSNELRDLAKLRDNEELSDRCLAVYVLALAGRGEPAYHEALFSKRDKLSAESRAYLALAMAESDGAPESITELLDPKKPLPAQEDLWFSSPARELAVRLLAACRTRPSATTVNTLVEELLQERRQGEWNSTQDNAWAVIALADYSSRVEGLILPSNGSLDRGPRHDTFRLDSKSPTFETSYPITADAALLPLSLMNPLQRPLYTRTSIISRPPVAEQPRQDRGYLLQRTYEVLRDDGTVTPMKDPRVGDRIRVTLKLEVRTPAHFLAIDDPLPGVFEGVNPAFKSQETRGGTESMDWFSDYQELREDRVLFFRDHVGPGSYTIQYLARVRAAGRALAPAAKIEEMYHPERFGLSAAEWISTRPLE